MPLYQGVGLVRINYMLRWVSPGQPIVVMSLMSNPANHVTDFSTVPHQGTD